MTEVRTDIHDLVEALCSRFDVDPQAVGHIEITPSTITFDVFKRNEFNSFYMTDGVVARDILAYPVAA